MVTSILSYVVVSLLTGDKAFNMARMLHHGKYRLKDKDGQPIGDETPAWGWRAFGMGKEFTWGDRVIYVLALAQSLITFGVFLVGTLLNLFVFKDASSKSWMEFWKYYVLVYFVISVVVTVWLSIGGLMDLRNMFATLGTMTGDARDDGTVVGHHNLDE